MEEEKIKQSSTDSNSQQNQSGENDQTKLRKIKIKTLTNTVYPLEVPQDDLKVDIEKATQVPIARQRLVCMGKLMQDKDPLSNYIKEDDSFIHLMAKIEQAPTAQGATTHQQQQPGTQQQPQQQQQQRMPQINRGNPVVITSVSSHPNSQDMNQFVSNLLQSISQTATTQVINQQMQQPQQQGGSNQQNQRQSTNQNVPQPQQQQQAQHQTQQQQPQQQQRTAYANQQQQQQQINFPRQFNSGDVQEGQNNLQQRQIALPHIQLYNLSQICNKLMGINSQFPGPPLPLPQNRNGLQLIGSYLASYQFQLQRILPYMSRLSELMQRENIMNDRNHRIETERLSHEISQAMEEIVLATQPVIGLFRDVKIGDRPGEFMIFDKQQNSINQPVQIAQFQPQQIIPNLFTQQMHLNTQVQTQAAQAQQQQQSTQHEPHQNQQQANIQNANQQQQRNESTITISMSGVGIEQGSDGAMTVVGIDSSNNPGNINLQGIIQNLIGNMIQNENDDENSNDSTQNINQQQQQQSTQPQTSVITEQQQQPTTFVQQAQQSQQNVNTATTSNQQIPSQSGQQTQQQPLNNFLAQMMQAPQSGDQQQQQQATQFNPMAMLNMLGGGQGQEGPGIMGMTLRQLMEQNNQIQSEDDQDFIDIFGDTKISDVMQAFLSNYLVARNEINFSKNKKLKISHFWITFMAKFRTDWLNQSRRKDHALAESFSKDYGYLFLPKENQKELVIEGFEPEQVLNEVLQENFLKIFEIIQAQYLPEPEGDTKFSIELVKSIKHLIGQTLFEISEGLTNGLDSLGIIFKSQLQSLLERHIGPQLAGLASMMLLDNLWNQFKKIHTDYKNQQEQEKIQQQQNSQKTEEEKQKNKNQEQQLLDEISLQSENDKDKFQQYQNLKVSQNYKMGDINYQGD